MGSSICFLRIKPLHLKLAIDRIVEQAKPGERVALIIYPDAIKLKVGGAPVEGVSVDVDAWRVRPEFDDQCNACWDQDKPANLVKVRQKDGTIEKDMLCPDCVDAMEYLTGLGFELVEG